MKSIILKVFIGLLLIIFSPLVLVALFGILYIAFRMIGGYSMIEGFHSFANFINSLVPHFPYITTVPIVILVLIVLKKFLAFRKINLQ